MALEPQRSRAGPTNRLWSMVEARAVDGSSRKTWCPPACVTRPMMLFTIRLAPPPGTLIPASTSSMVLLTM